MKGKAIYTPSGKAGEYSYWAVNFYNGCSANCGYCYCKKGVMSSLWSTTPTLKKSLVDIDTAKEIFIKEAENNLNHLREQGLFFNFTSDPFLFRTIDLNIWAMNYCKVMGIPVKALTKQTWWIDKYELPPNVSIGFTLTGEDDLEPGAPGNLVRIRAMEILRERGYQIWASIEPVINIDSAYNMILRTLEIVDHYKVGPLSGKSFELSEVNEFIHDVYKVSSNYSTVYWKDGFIEKMGIIRDSLPNNCVNRDYKWWDN